MLRTKRPSTTRFRRSIKRLSTQVGGEADGVAALATVDEAKD
jgi:hypothetical protein